MSIGSLAEATQKTKKGMYTSDLSDREINDVNERKRKKIMTKPTIKSSEIPSKIPRCKMPLFDNDKFNIDVKSPSSSSSNTCKP